MQNVVQSICINGVKKCHMNKEKELARQLN